MSSSSSSNSLSPSEAIKQELLGWKGVTMHEHDFATTRFYMNDIEMGHIHGNEVADLQFPPKISKKLVSEGEKCCRIMSSQNQDG
jgi:hypothetical protein